MVTSIDYKIAVTVRVIQERSETMPDDLLEDEENDWINAHPPRELRRTREWGCLVMSAEPRALDTPVIQRAIAQEIGVALSRGPLANIIAEAAAWPLEPEEIT